MDKAIKIAEKMADCQKRLVAADVPPRVQEKRADLATSVAKKLAFEAYPQWSMKPSNQGKCPTMADLASYIHQPPDLLDPWGHTYVIKCGAHLPPGARGIAVLSAGPDGSEGTADDLTSWQ